jgi:hypothetical protein
MATPRADSIILQFRRDYGDMRNGTTGAPIVLASEPGNDFTVVQVTELLVRCINEIITFAYKELGMDAKQLGDLFREYEKQPTTLTAHAGGNIAGTDKYLTGTLPADYGWLISAVWRKSGQGYQLIRPASPREVEAIVEGINKEATGPAGYVAGTSFVMAYNAQGFTFDSSDEIAVSYVARQVAITQGGSTDVLIANNWDGEIVRLMRERARASKTQ